MKITPETKTLAAIFQTNSSVHYVIPVYQRNYSWKDEQIETLFDDIKNEDIGYYVGNLLINTDASSNNVIDGQQRLTTLSLMLLAIHENLTSFYQKMNQTDPDFEKVSEARLDIKRQILDGDVVRLRLLDKDQTVWENLVKVLQGENPGKWGNYFLSKRYKYIRNELLKGPLFSTPSELLTFYKKLVNIELLQISVPNISDAYQVFASLNSKGMPLTPLDLLKNVYLSKNGDSNKWNKLKEGFKKNDEEDAAKLTSFILNNYDAFETDSTSSLTKGKIVKSYDKIFKSKGADYIDVLIKRAKVYLKIANTDNAYRWDLSGLAKLDATTCYPLVLNLLCNQVNYDLSDAQFNDILADLIKLYVQRNIALTPKASNLRSSLNGLRKVIVENGWKSNELVNKIHEKIKTLQPRWDSVHLALQDGIYDKNKKTTRFILISLERNYGTFFNKSNPDSLDDYDSNGNLRWSIEHIIPQGIHLLDTWKDTLSPDDRDLATEIQAQYVHRLGNLTLTPYNSEMGNKSFVEKKEFKVSDSLVGLSLKIYLNDSIDKSKNTFGINELKLRQAALEEKMKEVFLI
ncbi:DUF262 domain-containing protein [Lactiplantibacillus plantarum]|jgi:uncharacterized protein with ParB-like and HNH nuclease domain|uniref:DUF262 domain-containing protein n=1 Tax=Lactiplantibacillus plantarum TaxID=1590 RepID=UPI0028FC1922|nr:DUF262 domain-containing HNH endonuclease family protein [Lactiplantibacillus plantarum]WNW17325.1 DUF262 domain-containing HNH endonuclease family protein [Lactiplantibacillus plantarum]WNW20357.1 DUF262 domain-containing HNH endonuclease family protein [Lactiplantibacillus plantarum]